MMSDNVKDLWIVRTGQMWKIRFICITGVLGLIFFILMVWNINCPQSEIFIITGITQLEIRTAFLFSGLIFIYSLFLLIKCPACGKRPVYRILNTSCTDQWFDILITLEQCPVCGYSGKIESKESK